eukprot:12505294-Alexandrium_andersonii.AAC.1
MSSSSPPSPMPSTSADVAPASASPGGAAIGAVAGPAEGAAGAAEELDARPAGWLGSEGVGAPMGVPMGVPAARAGCDTAVAC